MTARSRTLGVATLVAAGALLLNACGSGAAGAGTQTGGTPVAGGSATLAVDSVFLGFDPNTTPAAQDARAMRQMFDSLLYLDADRKLQPWLAKSYETSADELTYTFTLRDDVKFHDGTPFNAEAVCFNLDRIKDPASGSTYAIGLIGSYASCQATNATTAVVKMATPFSPFLNNLTSPFMGMNSPTAAKGKKPADYTLAPVGSGPFKFSKYTPGDRIEMVRNDDYNWSPGNAQHTGKAYLEKLTFQIIPDATVRMGSVKSGSVQAGSAVPENEAAAIKANPQLQLITQQQSGAPYQLNFNSSKAPFDDVNVRKAARTALDIDAAVNALYMGVVARAWGPLAPTTVGYDVSVEKSFAYSADEANKLLDAAGWVKGADGVRTKNGQRLAITYIEQTPNREKRQDLATFFKANLTAVGFDVNLVFEQTAPLQTRQQNNDYNIAGLSLVAVDPNVMFQEYDPRFMASPGKNGFNLTRTNDPSLTAAVQKGQTLPNGSERNAIYAEAQKNVIDSARSVGIYVPTYTLAVNGMKGLRFDAEGYPIFYDAFLGK